MPSFYGEDYSNINIQPQTYTGLLSDIKELYGDISFKGNNQYFGLKFFNSWQTLLFTRSKIYGTYAIKVPISKNTSWITGAQVGVANVFFGQSAVTNGGSDWVLMRLFPPPSI